MKCYRVTDEALIAETAVWPNFFLMNVFFALKGSKLCIIIYKLLEGPFCQILADFLFYFDINYPLLKHKLPILSFKLFQNSHHMRDKNEHVSIHLIPLSNICCK